MYKAPPLPLDLGSNPGPVITTLNLRGNTMLDYLFKDSDGKKCGAKTLNSITYGIILFKITMSGTLIFGHQFATVTPADVQAFVMLLGVTSATYATRAYNKGNKEVGL